jgi:hypothetical protein
MPVIPAPGLRRLRQEDNKFEANLDYIKKKKKALG